MICTLWAVNIVNVFINHLRGHCKSIMCLSNIGTLTMWDSETIKCTHAGCSCHSYQHEAAGEKEKHCGYVLLFVHDVPPSHTLTLRHTRIRPSTTHCGLMLKLSPHAVWKAHTAASLWTAASTAPHLKPVHFNEGHFIFYWNSPACMSRPYSVLWVDWLTLSSWTMNISWSIQQNFQFWKRNGKSIIISHLKVVSFHFITEPRGRLGLLGEIC